MLYLLSLLPIVAFSEFTQFAQDMGDYDSAEGVTSSTEKPSTENTKNPSTTNSGMLEWKDINISLPANTSHQVVGYYLERDEVYLLGGDNVEDEYWSLKFNQSYDGWIRNEKLRFEDLKIYEYQQSYLYSKNHIIYLKTGGYIHIYDMSLDYFNLNVIELPIHIIDGCLTIYYDKNDKNLEYLIVIGSKNEVTNIEPTTWVYQTHINSHNITFFDIGPDLLGIRKDFCCSIMDDYLYVIGGIYDPKDTRFIEQWSIDIDTAYGVTDKDITFDNFTNINTLINIDVAEHYLPQFGHRCIVNDHKKPPQMYIIGGITQHDGDDYLYSQSLLILQRENDSLIEVNYRETEEEKIENPKQVRAKILPSLPTPLAYTAAMIDQYGYLNLFGGQLHPERNSDKWYRINTKYNDINDIEISNDDAVDIIWKNHHRHNHNEQWALLILLIMIILVAFWFKCVSKITKLRANRRTNGRGLDTDGTAYDEITGTDDIDELEDDIDDDNLLHGPSSDDNDYLARIMHDDDDEIDQHNSEVVV